MPIRSGSAAPPAPGLRPASSKARRPGDQAELAEAVELAGGLRRHPGQRVEVVDLCRDLRSEGPGIEAVDAPDGRATRPQARPEGVDAGADGAHDPDARDPDPASLAHDPRYVRSPDVDPVPASGSPAERLGQRLEGRQRTTRDRAREGPVDEPREARQPGPEVVVDRDPRAVAQRLDPPGHVHPLRRPGHMQEAEPKLVRLRPGAGAPGDRQAEPQEPRAGDGGRRTRSVVCRRPRERSTRERT